MSMIVLLMESPWMLDDGEGMPTKEAIVLLLIKKPAVSVNIWLILWYNHSMVFHIIENFSV